MQKQKHTRIAKKRGLYIVLALMLFVGAPVLGAILVQNFTQWDVVVDEPPVVKLQGADANYDGDGNDSSGYLQVNLGGTISNNDANTTATNLSHEEITFTCFKGDRTYYTDVIRLDNTTTGETWNVNLKVEADINGNAAVEDTFADGAGNADIWLVASDNTLAVPMPDSVGTNRPNPLALASPWETDAIHLEVINGVLSVQDDEIANLVLPDAGNGSTRQLGLIVDCDADMVDTETGTFRITVGSSPQ